MTRRGLFFSTLCLSGMILCSFTSCSNKDDAESTLQNAREKCIELNRQYNALFEVAQKESIYDDRFKYAANALNAEFMLLLELNKSLGIDCRYYDEDGNTRSIIDKNGKKQYMEVLPDVLREY